MPVRRFALAASLVLLWTSGCGREEAAESLANDALEAGKLQRVEVESANGQQHIRFDTGQGELRQTVGENVALPEGFPKDVKLPAGAIVVSVMTMGDGMSAVMHSEASMSSLLEHFKTAQADAGWHETMSMHTQGNATLGFEKNRRGLLVNLREDMDGLTQVSLSLQAL